ncbi:MAG: nucleotide-binding protein, partial [Lachnospiraceae bacterium]|nr:nucleotide-binding protein [Lachnospiraceae bacterium]
IKIRDEVTSLLKSVKYEPIVAVDKEANGRTIIEQIEKLTEVKKGIVIYTPDDVARLRKRYGGKTDQMFYRARQNVIFEHGYLCGKLGRSNVIMLICYDKKKEFDIPSDVNNIVHINYDDNGEWKNQVLKEISN